MKAKNHMRNLVYGFQYILLIFSGAIELEEYEKVGDCDKSKML